MGRIEELAERYAEHIRTPWQRTVAGAQRVIIVVYEKELERILRARKALFQTATHQARRTWHEVDVTAAFAEWLAGDEYREAYFEAPEDLSLKLESEFAGHIAAKLRAVLTLSEAGESSVVAVFGTGSLFGFARVSRVVSLIEEDIRGRLVVFFPGQYEQNNYRLLDARDGWNYLAVPITLHGLGGNP